MPRTKDLVLFVVVLLFLLTAISFTVVQDTVSDRNSGQVYLGEGEAVEKGATNSLKELDRESIITRLREAIKGEDTVIASTPVVLDETEDMTDNGEESEVPVCERTGNDIVFARTWPVSNVEVVAVEGVRMVAEYKLVETVPVTLLSSTTESRNLEKITEKKYSALMTLPIYPSLNAAPACLSSDIVGVTVEGGLLFNSDAIAYRLKDQLDLVGYARDGFPIYGNYSGEVDECGGAVVEGSYRYFLSSTEKRVLNCYMGQPQSFVGE